MAYGRIYIENLRNKVTAIFDELKAEDSKNNAKYKVFMFEDCPEIRKCVDSYLSERR